jgi:universal stress protein A
MKLKPTIKDTKATAKSSAKPNPPLLESARSSASHASALKLNKILVPVDFSDFSTKALDYALAFAEQFQARIILAHIVEPAVYPENYMLVPPALDDMNRDLLKAGRARLQDLGQNQIADRVVAETVVRLGRPHLEICEIARTMDVDLIIIATHGYTGLKHVLLGSTAERVVRHAPCPVLTVREAEREFVRRS